MTEKPEEFARIEAGDPLGPISLFHGNVAVARRIESFPEAIARRNALNYAVSGFVRKHVEQAEAKACEEKRVLKEKLATILAYYIRECETHDDWCGRIDCNKCGSRAKIIESVRSTLE